MLHSSPPLPPSSSSLPSALLAGNNMPSSWRRRHWLTPQSQRALQGGECNAATGWGEPVPGALPPGQKAPSAANWRCAVSGLQLTKKKKKKEAGGGTAHVTSAPVSRCKVNKDEEKRLERREINTCSSSLNIWNVDGK